MPTRRTFLKTGIIGGVLLTAIALLQKQLDRIGKRALVDAYPINNSHGRVVAAIVPVLLEGSLPLEANARMLAVKRTVDAVAVAIGSLSAASQKEVSELFALLVFPPARIALTGVSVPWEQAKDDEIAIFLLKWRNSPLDLLKSGYQALHDLVLGAWYADPAAWPDIGYPGPPTVLKR